VIKKKVTKYFVVGAILIFVCPFVLQYVFQIRPKYILQSIGIRYIFDEYWFWLPSTLLLVAFMLQFPFKEEEAWHCDCGYDLSYSNQKSKKCPECGKESQLEWSTEPGTFARKTTQRLVWAIFLLLGSLFMFGIGLLKSF
jgi:hypothetical protein